MAKSRKRRKNYKLRKRVMRTVSALTMAMAVTVAAIPVERYGTMEAAYEPGKYETNYNSVKTNPDKKYQESTYEKTDYSDSVQLQRITSDGEFENIFSAKKSSSGTAIIDGYTGNSKGTVEVREKEAYDYVVFDDAYRKALAAGLKDETYTMSFSNDAQTINGKSGLTVENTSESNAKLNDITINKLNVTPTYSGTIKTPSLDGQISTYDSGALSVKNNYTKVLTSSVGDILKGLGIEDSYVAETITPYNDRAQGYINELNQILSSITADNRISETNYRRWTEIETAVSALEGDKENINKKDYTYDSLYNEQQFKLFEYIILNRVAIKDGNDNLKAFQLEEVSYLGNPVWVLTRNESSVEKPSSNQSKNIIDGYLAGGAVTVVGIGHEAFKKPNAANISGIVIDNDELEFIGSGAFTGLNGIESVSINSLGCEIIGDNAFENCGALREISFSDTTTNLKTIGAQAFKNTALEEIVFPRSIQEIGQDSFSDSDLVRIGFGAPNTNTVKIDKYAFYNCLDLGLDDEGVCDFFKNGAKDYEIMEGAFAVESDEGRNTKMTSFVFPESKKIITEDKKDAANSDNDYILAGRKNLADVTMPANLSGDIPDNTFAGCEGLGRVYFMENAGNANYNSDVLFQGVTNPDFYVEGPMYRGKYSTDGDAIPRQCTWNATTKGGEGGSSKYVPYKYYDENDVECWEYGIIENGEAPYIASISMPEGENGAVLTHVGINTKLKSEKPNSDSFKNRQELVIDSVGGKDIVKIASHVVDDDILDKFYQVTIADDTVQVIEDEAFYNMPNLEWVEIGNAITDIGSKAFGKCPWLENVVFNPMYAWEDLDADSEEWLNFSIADDAFDTGSKYLTFHGLINGNYAPFVYAKADNSDSFSDGSQRQICYKTDDPLHLTVIRDNAGGDMTLIDYPHYEEVNLWNSELTNRFTATGNSITSGFEKRYGIKDTDAGEDETVTLYDNSYDIVMQTLKLCISDGIESVDTVKYFNNKSQNGDNFDYFNLKYTESPSAVTGDSKKYTSSNTNTRILNSASSKNDVMKLYSDAEYLSPEADGIESGITPGLFSGYFENTTGMVGGTYENHKYVEEHKSGNDNLTEAELPSVVSLPNNAFYSCENLLKVKIGAALEDFGELPFKDCKSLYSVDTNDNAKYTCDNLLLFENTDNGYNLIECFEGRGKNADNYAWPVVSESELSGVCSISPGAFSNCTEITNVDLSDSTITDVPNDCFDNDKKLTEVKLPSTISKISENSFTNLGDGLVTIEIPSENCYINIKAFDGKTPIRFRGVKLVDEATGEKSATYKAYEELVKAYNDEKDDSRGKFQFVDSGKEYIIEFVVPPDMEPIVNRDGTIASYVVTKDENGLYSYKGAIPEAPPITGYRHNSWVCRANGKTYYGSECWTDIDGDRTIMATYVEDPSSVVPEDDPFGFTVQNGMATVIQLPEGIDETKTVPAGTSISAGESANLYGGTQLFLIANDMENFSVWTASGNYVSLIQNPNSPNTSFTMPNANVTVTANSAAGSGSQTPGDSDNPSGGGDSDNPGGSGDNDDDNKTKYKLTVNYGSGSGEYAAGESVTISAYAPESSSRVFSRWTSNNASLGFASATSATTTLVMPEADVTVTANYKARVDDDDEDDDDSSRRPNTNTTTTVTNPSSGSGNNATNTSGTVNNGNNNGGSKIYITKNGVSNKDLASVSVSGSTDNFIVRISETDEATAAAEEALINRYGSLDGLVYFPMDISLYDSTGQNKITDTYGLNITITMPIPDVLIQYGGNSRVAATDNGTLQALNPVKFTTIDGIACISFVPPHFSPYVIYVDTNNLTAGQTLDSTPSTGDPIHPKWFLAIGMACVSVLLFAASDGRKRKKYRTA